MKLRDIIKAMQADQREDLMDELLTYLPNNKTSN